MSPASVTLPWTKAAPSGTLARKPPLRSSSTVTSWPRASSAPATCEPMKPAPPVTNTRAIRRRILPRNGERRLLDRLEIDGGPVVVEDRAQLVVARLRQVALRLEHEKARGGAGRELPLLRLQPTFGELARRARGL